MGWRAGASGLALAAILAPPASAWSQTAAGPDEVIILSPYRSYRGANNLPRLWRHAGVDFGSPLGAPVLAAADGVVSRLVESTSGCGHGVVIEHPGFKRWTAYCHMQEVGVIQGQRMRRGERIGLVGKSGAAMNIPHVHLELCTFACASHADGDLSGTADPLAIAAGCFDPAKSYPRGRLALTFPVACLFWVRGR
jgi:murein DD-endopeptidase MepM/ murein hydrolase activator NlpD